MKCLVANWLFIFSSLFAFGQKADTLVIPALPLLENRIAYTGNINKDSAISTRDLFHNAEEWYTHNYESADNTLTIDNINDGKISGTGIIHKKKKERKLDAEDIYFTIDIVSGKGGYFYKVYAIYSMDSTGKFYYSDMYNEYLYPVPKPKWSPQYKVKMLTNMNSRVQQMITQMQADLQKNK